MPRYAENGPRTEERTERGRKRQEQTAADGAAIRDRQERKGWHDPETREADADGADPFLTDGVPVPDDRQHHDRAVPRGRGSREETDAGFSSSLALAAAVSATFTVLVVLLRDPLAAVLGAGGAGSLHGHTAGYLAGFSLGAPFSMGALVLVPFLQMAGESTLLIAAVLGMTWRWTC